MGIFKRMVGNDVFANRSVEELEQAEEKWGRLARDAARDGRDEPAQYAREARAEAQAELKRRGRRR